MGTGDFFQLSGPVLLSKNSLHLRLGRVKKNVLILKRAEKDVNNLYLFFERKIGDETGKSLGGGSEKVFFLG